MNLIRNLIIKEWYKFFGASALVLFFLITISNLIAGFLRSNVTATEVIFNHLLELPNNAQLIFPVSCLFASLFSINKLKNRNELTAILASGYSRKKYILDLLAASSLIAIFSFFIAGFIQPFAKANKNILIANSEAKFRNLRSKGLRASTIGSGKMWYKTNDYFFSFSTYNKNEKALTDVTLYQFGLNHKLVTKINSVKIKFINGKWIGEKVHILNNLDNDNFPETKFYPNHSIPLQERPEDFSQIEADITTLNLLKLYDYIKKLQLSGINTNEYLVLFLSKFSTALVCFIFTILASISIFNPNRRGSSFGKNVAFVFIFTILYWLVNSYFIELGNSSQLHPVLSTFGVHILFTLFLTWFFLGHRKLK